MVTTILLLLVNLLEQDTSVVRQNQKCLHATGLVKNYGQEQAVLPRVHQKVDKENISIFVE